MLPIDTSYWALDLAGMIADLPAQATWDSTTFLCSLTQLDEAFALTLVGNSDDIVFECIFPVSAVVGLAAIVPNARISIQFPNQLVATSYQIVTARIAADSVAWTLILKADHRN